MKSLLFRQLFDKNSSTYTYLVGDRLSKEAVIVDTVYDMHYRDLALIKELGLTLRYVIDTHFHVDHISGAWLMQKATQAKTVLARVYQIPSVDREIEEGDSVYFGNFALIAMATPGHTKGCMTYVLQDKSMAFTGDTLLIRGAGRTDFDTGDPRALYRSVQEKIFTLPEHCLLYPAHDYQGRTVTSVKEEKAYNTRLALHGTEEEFVSFMQNLHLPPPAAMQEALTRNYELGKPETGMYPELASWAPLEKTHDGILQVPYAWMQAHAPFITVVDVSEKGDDSLQFLHTRIQHIPLRFLEQRYQETVKEKPIVLCCHSGISSARAFGILQAKGISRVAILKR